jgi:hypothetical protein
MRAIMNNLLQNSLWNHMSFLCVIEMTSLCIVIYQDEVKIVT